MKGEEGKSSSYPPQLAPPPPSPLFRIARNRARREGGLNIEWRKAKKCPPSSLFSPAFFPTKPPSLHYRKGGRRHTLLYSSFSRTRPAANSEGGAKMVERKREEESGTPP